MAYISAKHTDAIIAYGGTWDDQSPDARWAGGHGLSSVSISFYGTALWAYGDFNPGNADFSCYVNDTQIEINTTVLQRYADGNQVFLMIPNLTEGTHNVSLSLTRGDLGIGRFEWYNPQASTTPGPLVNGKTDSISDWTVPVVQNSPQLSNTSTLLANITFTFQGTGIAVNGLGGPDAGSFNVTLDDMAPITRNAWSQYVNHSSILHRNDGLPDGNHTLVLTNIEERHFQVGQAETFIAPSNMTAIPSPTATTITPTSANTNARRSLSKGGVAGVVIAVLGCLAIVAFAVWFWLRKRQAPLNIYERNHITYERMCSKCRKGIRGSYRLECVNSDCPANIDLHPECHDWNTSNHHDHEVREVRND